MLIRNEWLSPDTQTVARLSDDFTSGSYAVMSRFLSDVGLSLLRRETDRLLGSTVRKDFQMECMGGSDRRMKTLGAPVIDRLSTLVPDLYYSPEVLELIGGIVGGEVYALQEDVDRYVLNALTVPGDTFGAHFDDYPLSLVVVVEVAPDGARPRILPGAENATDVLEDYAEIELLAADAYLLRADTVAHMVSGLGASGRRVAFNFAYALEPQTTGGTESPALLYSREASGEETSPVLAYTEWDPLEEVIVGSATGSRIPRESERMVRATMPDEWHHLFLESGGELFPDDVLEQAQWELDNLAQVLTDRGIVVRRPVDLDWSQHRGYTGAMPRDSFITIGTSIIEAPMVWRSRQNEVACYRELLAEYAAGGASWVSAPRSDPASLESESGRWAINESAPAFDAADFIRVGHDIVGQLSHVTNMAGVDWLRQYLGADHSVTILDFDDAHAMHIDATIMPLRPGLLLVNGTRVDPRVLDLSPFTRWDRIVIDNPRAASKSPLYMTSGWINMNVLSLDANTVVIEESDTDVARQLEEHGFEVVAVPFQHVNSIGGSLHCATVDVRRRGTREIYV